MNHMKYDAVILWVVTALCVASCTGLEAQPSITAQSVSTTATRESLTITEAVKTTNSTIEASSTVTVDQPTASATRSWTMPACPGKLLAFWMTGSDNLESGIYLGCAGTGMTEFAFGKQQYPSDIEGLDISHDGYSLLFLAANNNEVVGLNLKDYRFKTLISSSMGKWIENPRLSPDGEFIGYISHPLPSAGSDVSDHLEFLHLSTQNVSRIDNPLSLQTVVHMLRFQWSSDGSKAMYIGSGPIGSEVNTTFVLDLRCDALAGICSGSNLHSLTSIGMNASLSHDGNLVVSYFEDQDLPGGYIQINDQSDYSVWKIALYDLDPDLSVVAQPVFAPDSSQVAFIGRTSTKVNNIYVLDLAKMSLTNLTGNTSEYVEYGLLTW